MDPLVASIQSTIQAQWREISHLGVRLERVEQRESLMSNATSLTLSGDLAVNGGDITSTATTFNLLNATVTTLNLGGAATTVNFGNAAGTVFIPGNLNVSGTLVGTFSSSGNVLMPDDAWIGLAADGGRISFDSTPATDEISILNANVLMTASRTIDGMDPSAHIADAAAHHAAVTLASPNHGLGLAGQVLSLGTPSALTVATTSAVTTTTHTHAITSSSSPGAAASILASDASGYVQLVGLGIGVAAGAANRITIVDGGSIGQAAGPLLTFNDTSNYLSLAGADFGIGTTPSQKLDVRDGLIALTDANVAHGMTTWASTETYGLMGPDSATDGGLRVWGFSDTAGQRPLVLLGIFGNTDPTDTVGAVVLSGGKKNSTSIQALAATETVLVVDNWGTSLLTILGNGNVGVNTTGPDRRLDVLDASNPQLRLTHTDGTVYTDFQTDGSGYTVVTPSGGRLGILTTPLYPFHVLGNAGIDGDLYFVGAQTIRTTADSLTLAPAADLDLTPGGTARVRATSGVRLQSDNYASQTTGWGISYAGSGDFRYLYADELHAKAFIADLEQALAGGQIISKSVAPLASNFTAPAAGADATLVVESFKGFDSFKVFVDGDMVRIREFSRAGTSLSITNCWGTVVWVSTDTTAKTQTYTFTRSAAFNAGAITAGTVVGAGTLVLDYGTDGNGFLESNAIDGAMAEYAPYHQIVKWTTHPNSGLSVRTRLGNLKGIFNVANEYGLYAGSGVTDADQYLRISDQAIEGHNLPIKLYDGASVTVSLSPTAPSFAMGATLPSAFGTGDGIWMGKDTLYKFRVGDVDGELIQWDGADLYIMSDATNYVKFTGNDILMYSNNVNVITLDGATSTVTVGVTSSEHIAISSTAVQIKDGATVYTDLTAGVLSLGDTANEHTLINTSGVALKDGANVYALFAATTTIGLTASEHISISSTSVQIKDGATVYTDLTAGALTLGQSASEHVAISATAVQIKDGATVYTDLTAGALRVGELGAGKGNVYIASGAISVRLNTTDRIALTSAGVLTVNDSGGNAVITLDAALGAEITKKLTMPGANSAIAIGATPPTSATVGTGIWIDRTGMYGLAANVQQAIFDAATGKITAGAGNVLLDSTGAIIRPQAGASNSFAFWVNGETYPRGRAYYDSTANYLRLDKLNQATGAVQGALWLGSTGIAALCGSDGFHWTDETGTGSIWGTFTSTYFSSDVASFYINGGNLKTTATTFALLNTTATTVNAFGAATAVVVNTTGFGIGATPSQKLDVRDGLFALTDADVAHGMTTWASTETYGLMGPDSATDGGLRVWGFSDTAGQRPLVLLGIFGNTDPTDTVGAVVLSGGKKNSTSIQALAATETVLVVDNWGTSLLTILGNGNVGIGTTAINTWASDYVAVRLAGRAALWGSKTDGICCLSENMYADGTYYRGIANAAASVLTQSGGALEVYTAPANGVDGILTLTRRLLVDATGTKVTSGYSGGTVGALDDYDDAMVLHRGMSEGQAQALVDVGVLEQHGDVLMWDIERAFMLLGGGIYQTRAKVDGHEHRIVQLERENRELRAQLARLN